jgi:hypothetical protein
MIPAHTSLEQDDYSAEECACAIDLLHCRPRRARRCEGGSMKLPTKLGATLHRHGGRIISIDRIEHVASKPIAGRSTDTWHYIGDVEWNDGTRSKGIQIAPWALVFDGDKREECDALSELLSRYLAKHGAWFDHDASKHEGWYATKRVAAKGEA